ncbi:MAG: hypothetical protein ACOH5I_18445 [Oligoflexus sp.]
MKYIYQLSFSLIYLLASCHSNINDRIAETARHCQVPAVRLEDKTFQYLKFTIEGQSSRPDEWQTLNQSWLTAAGEQKTLDLTPGGCLQIPANEAGLLSLSLKDQYFAQISLASGFSEELISLDLRPVASSSLSWTCPTEGYFVQDHLDLDYELDSSFDLRSSLFTIEYINSKNSELTHSIEVKPIGMHLTSSGSLSLPFDQEGSYFLKVKIAGFLAKRFQGPSESCLVRVLRSKPSLEIHHPRLQSGQIISLAPFSFVPVSLSDHAQLMVCRKKDLTSCAEEEFTAREQISFGEVGHWFVEAFASDPAGNRSNITSFQVQVDASAPSIKARWLDEDLNRIGARLRRPQAIHQIKVELADDINSPEELAEKLQCRARVEPDKNTTVRGHFIRCLSAACRGQKMNEFVPCDSNLKIDLGHEHWQHVLHDLVVEFKVEDELEQQASSAVRMKFDPDNSFLWEKLEAKELGIDPQNNASLPAFKAVKVDGMNRSWFYSSKELYLYENQKWSKQEIFAALKKPEPSGYVLSYWLQDLEIDSQQQFWIGTSKGLFFYANEDDHRLYQASDLPDIGVGFGSVSILEIDADDQVYVVQGNRIFFGDRTSFQAHPCNIDGPDPTGKRNIAALQLGENGKLWAFSEAGLLYYDGSQCQRTEWPQLADGTPANPKFFQDYESRVWVSWPGELLSYTAGQVQSFGQIYRNLPAIKQIIGASFDRQGHLWLLGFNKAFRINKDLSNYEVYDPWSMGLADTNPLYPSYIYPAADDSLWFFASSGTYIQRQALNPFIDAKLPGWSPFLKSSPSGALLNSGWTFQQIDQNGYHSLNFREGELPLEYVDDIQLLDDNKKFFTGKASHLGFWTLSTAFFDGKSWQLRKDYVQELNTDDHLRFGLDRLWSSLFINAHDYWVGTAFSGIIHVKDGEMQAYPEVSGRYLYRDSSGRIWAAGKALSQFQNGQWSMIDHETEPQVPLTKVQNIVEDRHGQIWALGLSPGTVGDFQYKDGIYHGQGRLMRLTGNGWELAATGLEETNGRQGLYRLGLDDQGRACVMGYRGGLAVWDDGWKIRKTPRLDQMYYSGVEFVPLYMHLHQDELWFANSKRGVFQLDRHFEHKSKLLGASPFP